MFTRVHRPATWYEKVFAYALSLSGLALLAWAVWIAGGSAWHWLREGDFAEVTRLATYLCGGDCGAATTMRGLNKILAWLGECPAWVAATFAGLGLMGWGTSIGEGEWIETERPD
jgi:hypothetical protein